MIIRVRLANQEAKSCTNCCNLSLRKELAMRAEFSEKLPIFYQQMIITENLQIIQLIYYYKLRLAMLAVQERTVTTQVMSKATAPDRLFANSQQGQKVKIYLRKVNKETFIQYIESPVLYKDIFALAQNRCGVNASCLLLFWKGHRIQQSNIGAVEIMEVQQNDIIHIHDTKNVNKKCIKIVLKSFQCTKCDNQLITIETSPKQLIGQTIQKYIKDLAGTTLIESGRKLNMNKSFQDESIQSEATIILTSFNIQIPIKSHIKVENKSTLKSTEASEFLQQQKENKKMEVAELNFKRRTSWSHSNQSQIGSFKKKSKPSVYVSINDSQGEDVIWESESSSELNKSNHIQKLAIRKAHQTSHTHKQVSTSMLEIQKPVEDMKNRKKQQRHKSFETPMMIPIGETTFKCEFENRKQIKEPPLISFNDFQEQEEEMKEFQDKDIDIQDDFKQEQFGKKPINLGASIGKSRGNFIPVIPTEGMTLDDDDSDDDQQF